MAVPATVAWAVSIFVAVTYLGAGIMKIVAPGRAMAQSPVLAAVGAKGLRVIGVCEILGAIGVVVAPFLGQDAVAGAAAVGLAFIQILAIPRHARLDARVLPLNVILLLAATFVAVVRFGVV